MTYLPGTHLVATIKPAGAALINDYGAFREKINQLIRQFSLNKLGEVYHNFQPAGFTAVICLSESHISIHTWPEHSLANLDIYLSNYQRSNDNTVVSIFEEILQLFDASVLHQQCICR